MSIKVLQLQKRSSYEYKFIQDKYAINISNKSFALADGTTQSFCSEIWAGILTTEFVKSPNFNSLELISELKEYAKAYKNVKFEFSPNSAIASIERTKMQRGGTSTLLGLQFIEENKLNIITSGDSNLFLLKKNNDVTPFPFTNIDSLDNNNSFLNTEQLLDDKIDETFFTQKIIDYELGDKIIIATDALSRFILKNITTLSEVIAISNFESLHKFCLKYWGSKELEEDDISAIIIEVNNDDIVNKIFPPIDFYFPKEKEPEFIPNSLLKDTILNFTDMQMQEIRSQFNGVKNDFEQVKKKQKQNELLIFVAISLLLLNLFAIYHFSGTKKGSEPKSADVNSENSIEKIVTKINSLEQKLENFNKPVSIDTTKKGEPTIAVPTLSKKEAQSRQKELRKAGYETPINGIWGKNSERMWQKYQNNNGGNSKHNHD